MSEVRLRDTRRADWFWVQNVLIDVFQPVIGPLGVTVYNTLCREVRRDVVDVTLRELGQGASVSKDTAARMLWKMQALGMVGVRQTGRGRKVYVLFDLEDAAGPGEAKDRIGRLRCKLAEAEVTSKNPAPKKSFQEVALELEGPGLFDMDPPAFTPLKDLQGAQLHHAHEVAAIFEVRAKDIGVPAVSVGDKREVESPSLRETSCLKSGGVLSQNEGVLSQNSTAHLMLLEDKTRLVDKPHLNPPAGRTSGSLAEVLAGLPSLKPREGDLSDLREQIAQHMRAAEFQVQCDAPIADRGDGRQGMLDLWCVRMTAKGVEKVAIECDSANPRQKSATKLMRVHDATPVLVLRTAVPAGGPKLAQGIHWIAMGWPVYANVTAQPTQQQARAAVGAAPMPESTSGAVVIGPAGVRLFFETLRGQVENAAEAMGFTGEREYQPEMCGVVNPLVEWDGMFGSAAYSSHEETDGGTLLVLSSAGPKQTLQGLQLYRDRFTRAMQETFGCSPQVQVVAEREDSG